MPIEQVGGTELIYTLNTKLFNGPVPADIAQRTMKILKHRVDPDSQNNIVFPSLTPTISESRFPSSVSGGDAWKARLHAEFDFANIPMVPNRTRRHHQQGFPDRHSHRAHRHSPKVHFRSQPAGPVSSPEFLKAKADSLYVLESLTDAATKLNAIRAKVVDIKPQDYSAADLEALQIAHNAYNAALEAALSLNIRAPIRPQSYPRRHFVFRRQRAEGTRRPSGQICSSKRPHPCPHPGPTRRRRRHQRPR